MSRVAKGAIPSGSLRDPCAELWRKADYRLKIEDRSYFPTVDDDELDLILLRPQEIPRYVAQGKLDFGICGWDCVVECDCEKRVVVLDELIFSKASRERTRWVLAVPTDSPLQKVTELWGKLIATEFVRMSRKWLKERSVQARVEFSWGTTEVKPGRNFCNAVIEATETGRSLKANGLREIDEVMRSAPVFIVNRKALCDPWKKEKMTNLCVMLRSALEAEGKVMLVFNVLKERVPATIRLIPSLESPTVGWLANEDWRSLSTIIDESVVREIIPRLKRAGAKDIVVLPITKLVR